MALSSEKIHTILEGGVPEGAQEISNEKGRKVIRRDGEFYKVVSEQDLDTLKEIYFQLKSSEHTPETKIQVYPDSNQLFADQEAVEQKLPEATEKYGIDSVVSEVIQIYEEFIDRGFVPKELDPKDIRFDEEANGVLIDYLDTKSVGKLEEQNMTPSAQTAFNVFADRTAEELQKNKVMDYDCAYSNIIEMLREEADYISIMGRTNNELNGLVTYNGP